MSAEHGSTMITCPVCGVVGGSEEEMNRHINTIHLDCNSPSKPSTSQRTAPKSSHVYTNGSPINESAFNSYSCTMCSEFHSDSLEALNLHVNYAHLSNADDASSIDAVIPKDESDTDGAVINSIDTEGAACSDTLNAKICNETVSEHTTVNSAPISSNIRREQISVMSWSCPVCDVGVSDKHTLDRHLTTSHPEVSNLYQDGWCHVVFTFGMLLLLHVVNVTLQ